MFRVDFNREVEDKIKRLAKLPKVHPAAPLFWKELASLVEQISATPLEVGEAKYKHKHVDLTSYLVVRACIAIHFAVSEKHRIVIVERLTLSGSHPYPREFDEILKAPS